MIFCHAHLQSGDPKVIKWWHVSRHIVTSYALLKSSIGSQKNPHWGELWYGLCRRLPFTTVLTRFIGMIGMNWQKSLKSEGINFGCIPWRVECWKIIFIWIEILWFYDKTSVTWSSWCCLQSGGIPYIRIRPPLPAQLYMCFWDRSYRGEVGHPQIFGQSDVGRHLDLVEGSCYVKITFHSHHWCICGSGGKAKAKAGTWRFIPLVSLSHGKGTSLDSRTWMIFVRILPPMWKGHYKGRILVRTLTVVPGKYPSISNFPICDILPEWSWYGSDHMWSQCHGMVTYDCFVYSIDLYVNYDHILFARLAPTGGC